MITRTLVVVATTGLLTGMLAACDDEPDADAQPADYTVLTDDDENPDQTKGEAGRYALTARGDGAPMLAVLELPAGFTNFGAFALRSVDQSETTPFRAVQYWTVNGVFDDPCGHVLPAPEVGPGVGELVAALAAQRTTRTSDPVQVSLDGYQGSYVELTVPTTVRVSRCADGYFMPWEGKRGDAQHSVESPGTVEHLWILDVEGQRVVLDAIAAPGVTPAQIDELDTIVESVEFVSR